MAARTKTPHVKMTEKQYEELEELVERGEYTSKDEFIEELLRERFDDFTFYLYERAEKDREKHIPLEVYGKSKRLE
jgi:Arc/MetJ-type ribon-helix-helix transcriptional regulator